MKEMKELQHQAANGVAASSPRRGPRQRGGRPSLDVYGNEAVVAYLDDRRR